MLLRNIVMLSVVMLVGDFIQMAIWMILFVLVGEFAQFTSALYFSGVTFATLG